MKSPACHANPSLRARLLAIAGALGLFATSAEAALFDADFENGTVNASVPATTPQPEPAVNINPSTSTAWNGTTLGNYISLGYPDAATGYTFGDGKVAVSVDGHSGNNANLYFQGSSNTTGRIAVTWDMMFKSGATQNGNVWTTFVDSSNQTIFQIMWGMVNGIGTITLTHFTGGSSFTHLAGPYPTGLKLTLFASIDLDADTIRVTMNGVPLKDLTTQQSSFPLPANCSFAGTRFFGASPAIRTLALDNFKARPALTIVSGNTSTYSIYRLPDANVPDSVIDAAADLQTFIQAATGVTLPLVKAASPPAGNIICVGNNPTATAAGITSDDLPWEAFRIATQGNNIFILGPDNLDDELTFEGGFSRGTRNGVSTFLEDYVGVRWLTPHASGYDVPSISTITVPTQNITRAPFFVGRRMDYVGVSTSQQNPGQESYIQIKKWLDRNKLGQSVNVLTGHSWDDRPALSAFSGHPDYMAWTGASWMPPTTAKRKFNTTHPGLITAFVDALAAEFGAPDQPYSRSISPTDSDNWCTCNGGASFPNSNCRAHYKTNPPDALSPTWGDWGDYYATRSDLITKFYYDVCNDLATRYPQYQNRKLGGYIYASYGYPPEINPAQIHPMMELFWAPRQFYGPMLYKTSNAAEFPQMMAQFRTMFGNHWNYSDYPNWLRNFVNFPLPTGHNIIKMITKELRSAGTKQVVINSNSAWGYASLRNYLWAKLLWDPYQDADALKTEWMQRMYGAAAPKMSQIYDLLETSMSTYINSRPVVPQDWTNDMTSAVIAGYFVPIYWQIENLYKQADGLVAAGTPQQTRLDMFGDCMIVATYRLRKMGMPALDTTPSYFYKSDGDFATWAAPRWASAALEARWSATGATDYGYATQNDHPNYNVTYDDAPANPGQRVAVQTQGTIVGVNTRFQTATGYNAANDYGTQIYYDYADSVAPFTPFPTIKQLVFRDNSAAGEVQAYMTSKDFDSASLGVMEIRWKMMIDSQAGSAGNFNIQFNNSEQKTIANLAIVIGGSAPFKMRVTPYATPHVPGTTIDLCNYTKGTVYDMKVRLNFGATPNPTATYYVNNVQQGSPQAMPKWCDFRQVKIATNGAAKCVVATDNWYVGR